ncbi:MAG: DNA-binding protein [Planctomycetes bacterium RIFOXYD2_FULL_41_16]|nr:MAG: DNA-binding protein [Planctomycetes bacterium GWE2_41_14]OHC06201.1 MAG: DNA-binding protein [Planctomycetes bacterium RIFOXYC2_FULL_41_27]OHC07295.1 MAG: DNA-binding protein [Planctomycetes bacterium RIFOXYD2_FULL_41_16]
MKYQVGKVGRVVVAKFEDKEDVLGNLGSIVKKEGISAAVFYLVGGMREGKIVVGPERDEIPPTPVWKNLGESHEVVGFGTIFYQGNEPKVHFHGAFGKKDMVKVGCLRENSATFLVLEAVIIELSGINAVREFDPALGLTLLKL